MKICLVCSHGGHLTEMMELMDAFRDNEVFFITYRSDRTEELARAYLIDNFALKPWTIGKCVLTMARIMIAEKPRIVVSTGAEIAAPAFLLAKLMRIHTVYVESCARVTSASGTGRLVYWISDRFFVQWQGLLKAYGRKAIYEGGLL